MYLDFDSFQADLEKLKSDASLALNEAFFGQLADAAEGGEGRAVAFLQVELVFFSEHFLVNLSGFLPTDILLCRVSCGAHSAWLRCTHSDKGSLWGHTFGARFGLI